MPAGPLTGTVKHSLPQPQPHLRPYFQVASEQQHLDSPAPEVAPHKLLVRLRHGLVQEAQAVLQSVAQRAVLGRACQILWLSLCKERR